MLSARYDLQCSQGVAGALQWRGDCQAAGCLAGYCSACVRGTLVISMRVFRRGDFFADGQGHCECCRMILLGDVCGAWGDDCESRAPV